MLGLGGNLSAVQISGTIEMGGTATLNNTLSSATAIHAFNNVVVQGTPSGSFTGVSPGISALWNAFSWDPSSLPVTLWTFAGGPSSWTYSFVLNDISFVAQSPTFLELSGQGILSITGAGSSFTPTAGTWSFRIDQPGVPNTSGQTLWDFRFGSGTSAVPEGGMTAILLGAGMASLAFLRRRIT